MIEVIVTLNGVEFELRVRGNVYNGEMPDYNAAVDAALLAFRQRYPLDVPEVAGLTVKVERKHSDVAARDGEGVETERAPVVNAEPQDEHGSDVKFEDLSDEELEDLTEPDEDPDSQELVEGSDEA